MFVAIDGKAVGLIGVADPIKASTPRAIRDLHADGVQVVMPTGDNRTIWPTSSVSVIGNALRLRRVAI